jgi:formate dehydrogenase gamma subunit
MILGVAGFMLLWVLADLFRRFRRWGWHWKSKHREPLPVAPETPIQRWDIHQRIQHLMLLGSFVMLVLTGLPMLFPLSPVSRLLVGIAGGTEIAGVIHRIMASILLLVAAYHVIYLFVRLMRRKLGTSIIPRHIDMMDAYHYTRYYAGLEKDPPRAGRYTFDEKVEYWSMIWGTIVMALTGSVLWFPLGPARILGVWVVDLSRVIHGYEALLAAISIIIWHLYHAHLNPDVFPMSRVWLTGKLTAAEEAHHHPLEFDQLVREGKLKPESPKKRRPPRK